MNCARLTFVAIGIAGIGAALVQPVPFRPLAQRARIEEIMRRHGYVASGQIHVGSALTIMKFSSPSCAAVRVAPVSTLLQEKLLLEGAGFAGGTQRFIYGHEAWEAGSQKSVAVSHLSQQFLQMIRVRPDPAIDTMLYVLSPKGCATSGVDWNQFWSPQPIAAVPWSRLNQS